MTDAPANLESDCAVIDARGYRCPMPVLLMERAFRRRPADAALKILADDPLAVVDIPHFARAAGRVCRRLPDDAGACVFLVTAR
ncbi:MAG: sulfurtransferase TusA family protein [Alphaproteobacteria bacterium]|nr:sulfurtransferase TusA family protein [Alphaproteobacteria bacterium]